MCCVATMSDLWAPIKIVVSRIDRKEEKREMRLSIFFDDTVMFVMYFNIFLDLPTQDDAFGVSP